MEQTIQQFRPNLKPSTIKQYTRNLNALFKVLPKEDPFNDIKLIEDKLKGKSYLTLRNYYTAIIIYLQLHKKDEELIKQYTKVRDELNEQYVQENKTGKISEAQSDKFIEYDKFMKMIKDLKGYINWAIKSDIPYSNDFHKKYTAYVIFEMLSRFPTRLDMAGMKYLNNKSYNLLTEEEKKHNNYLVKDGAKLFFSYNDYKTSGKYNEITIDVPADLKKILNAYIKFRKIKFQDILFVYRTGGPLSRTAVGELLAEISLEFIGVRLGTTIIRKIIASHEFLDHKKKQSALAANMMHSTATQNLIYIKEK
jgi:hypothetical protein